MAEFSGSACARLDSLEKNLDKYDKNVQPAVHKETSNCKELPDYFHYYDSNEHYGMHYIEKITAMLGKVHDTSDKFKENVRKENL